MDTIWKMDPAKRKELYSDPGNTWWIEVGGPTANLDGSAGPGRGGKKAPVTAEPVFWHPSDPLYVEEIAHSYCLRDVYDLTAAEGTTALTFAKLKVPYVGLCLTQSHMDELSEWLKYKHFSNSFNSETALAAMFPQLASPPTSSANPSKPKLAVPPKMKAAGAQPKGGHTAQDMLNMFQTKLSAITQNSAGAAAGDGEEAADSQD